MRFLVPTALAAAVAFAAALTTEAPAGPLRARADCGRTSIGLVPLTDFAASRRYRGYRGGLYPNGRNRPSPAYLRLGMAASKRVRPIDGKIVLLSIGMSNATQEFAEFKRRADEDPLKDPAITIVDGAQGGQDAQKIRSPGAPYWSTVEARIRTAGALPAQVQAIWLKEARAGESKRFPGDARALQSDLRAVYRILRARFANLQLVYLSSRTYAGYAITSLNPEPHAYDSGFAVRWLIQDRMAKRVTGPWAGWGPYLWTDGLKGRRDGFAWSCEDVAQDGTHPSKVGAQKVAARLFEFFTNDPTARPWFRA
jgi:hypothetical protein